MTGTIHKSSGPTLRAIIYVCQRVERGHAFLLERITMEATSLKEAAWKERQIRQALRQNWVADPSENATYYITTEWL